jgi:hypothetical protein
MACDDAGRIMHQVQLCARLRGARWEGVGGDGGAVGRAAWCRCAAGGVLVVSAEGGSVARGVGGVGSGWGWWSEWWARWRGSVVGGGGRWRVCCEGCLSGPAADV